MIKRLKNFQVQPKENYFRDLKRNDIYAPIFILFGDRHGSISESCEPCDNFTTCYDIYDDRFLKLIDSLAEPEYPIDYFIEGYMHNVAGDSDIFNIIPEGTIPKLRENIATCYKRELRGTTRYEKECPTKNIRWHSGDTRFWATDKYNFEAFINMFLEIFSVHIEDKKNIRDLSSSKFIDILISVYRHLLKKIKKKDILYYFHIISQYGLFTNEFNRVWLSDDNIKSLIKKQLNKVLDQSEPGLNEKFNKKWYIWTTSYINYKLTQHNTNIDFNNFYKGLADVFINIIENSESQWLNPQKITNMYINWIDMYENNNKVNKLIEFCIQHKYDFSIHEIFSTSMFLDLYTILRAFKKPNETGRNALVAFGCFGAYHTKDIAFLLTNIMRAYEVVFSNSEYSETDTTRCVRIDQYINLNELINLYKNIIHY
jgi:hypothetical protein